MKAKKLITGGSVVVVTLLVLIYTTGITQMHSLSAARTQPAIVDTTVTDSVEVVGTPVNVDPWKEIEQIVEAYYSKTGITYKGTIHVIDDNGDKEKTIEEQSFEYTLLGSNYYYRLANIEMVSKKNYLLAVDHENKMISFSRQKNNEHLSKLFDVEEFRKLMLNKKAKARVTQTGGDVRMLTVDSISDPAIQGYRIYYSPKSYALQKMLIGMVRATPLEEEKEETNTDGAETEEGVQEYYYYLEVLFNSITPLSLNETAFNPERKFISIENGNISLTAAYKDYQLLNSNER